MSPAPKRPCPKCSSFDVLPIVYGLFDDPPIGDDDQEARPAPTFARGGCEIYADSPDLACQACHHRWQSQPGGPSAELERMASTKVWIDAADLVEPPEPADSLARRAEEAVDAFQAGLAAYLAACHVTVEVTRFPLEPGRRILTLRGPDEAVVLYPEACPPPPERERDGSVPKIWTLSRRRLMTLAPMTPRWYVVLVDGRRGRGYLIPAGPASAALASGDWPLGSPDQVVVAEEVLDRGLAFYSAAECGALLFEGAGVMAPAP